MDEELNLPARQQANGAEHSAVKNEHDQAGNVEGRHRRVDEEVGVVEGAEGGRKAALFGVVHTERYRRRHSDRDDPSECY